MAPNIFSAITSFASDPARVSVASFSPKNLPSSTGGSISSLVKSLAPVVLFLASFEFSNFKPNLDDVQVEELPGVLFQIPVFVEKCFN